MDIIQKAKLFATVAHAAVGQKRKYSGDDYIVHPIRVARLVKEHGGTDEMIAAALLHDVIEDTHVSPAMIAEEFGWVVFKLVLELTDTSKPEDGNRAVRKGIDAKRLGLASEQAQIIKLADLIDNSADIVANDPKFAKVFLQEKANLLDIMTKIHSHSLYAIALGAITMEG
jgi:(p)ppGpp synthase/HD superfamily hydrolase